MSEKVIDKVEEMVEASPLRKGVASWYEGVEEVVNLKDGDDEIIDLIYFDLSEETEGRFMREYQVYRVFSLGGRANISVDNTFVTPAGSSYKELDALSKKFVEFIKGLFDRHLSR